MNCAPKKEMDEYIESLEIGAHIIQSRVDFTKHGQNPLVWDVVYRYGTPLLKDRLTDIGVKVRNNTLQTSDSRIY